LAFVATLLAFPAVSRAEQLRRDAIGPNMASAVSALLEKPTSANLQAVRAILVADRAYNPYSDDLTRLNKLFQAGKNQEVIELLVKSQPNLLLSPRAHRLAAEAAQRIGDKNVAATESVFATRCLDGILATGDGSESRPFLIARPSDEADLLDARFKTRIASQGLIFRDDMKHDKIIGKDGQTYWFDVSMLFNREKTAEVQPPAAAGPETHGLEARATLPPVPGLNALVQRGLDAYRAGQNDAALSVLKEAIGLDPHNAGIHVDRGNVWYVKQEYEQAIADFSEAILLDPDNATAHGNRGLAWSRLGEQDIAITDFNAAIRLQANFSRAYNGRGAAFQAKGMIDTAIADFDEAIRLNPSYAAAYENRGSAYAKKGNKALADADAAKARQLRGAKAAPAASTTALATPSGK
jgi:tetratricopeptide (TPR) repeat protein